MRSGRKDKEGQGKAAHRVGGVAARPILIPEYFCGRDLAGLQGRQRARRAIRVHRSAGSGLLISVRNMSLTTGARLDVASRTDARGRLLVRARRVAGAQGLRHRVRPARQSRRGRGSRAGSARARVRVDRRPARSRRGAGVVSAHRHDDVPAHAAPPQAASARCSAGCRRQATTTPRSSPIAEHRRDESPSACTAPAGAGAPRRSSIARSFGALLGRLDAAVRAAAHRARAALRPRPAGVPEIAEMLGVELATAKTHLVRGLARLRDLMEEHR